MPKSPFLSSLEEYMTVRRYSKRTIRSYSQWCRSYILFHNKTHPKALNVKHVEDFLTHLSVTRMVPTSTQRIALNALAFLYNKFLEHPLGDFSEFNHVKKQPKLPRVLN
jgi:site-specific recombinase XerD